MGNYLFISDAAKEVEVESHVLRYWEEELHLPIKRNELGHRYYTKEDVERFKTIKGMKERGLQLKAIKMILKDGKLDLLTGRPGDLRRDIEENTDEGKPEGIRQQENSEQTGEGEQTPESGQSVKNEQAVGNGRLAGSEQAESGESVYYQNAHEPENDSERDKLPQTTKKLAATGLGIVQAAGSGGLAAESKEEKSKRLQWLLQQLIRETLQENNEELCREIKESVVKELDYQFRMQEEREERRDKMLQERDEEYYKRMDELLRKKAGKKFGLGKKKKGTS